MLTPKQKRFVAEYLVDLNATQAAIRAGYSEKSAASQGERLLRNAEIEQLVSEKTAKTLNKLDIGVERTLEEVGRLAFSNMMDYIRIDGGEAYVDLSTLTREQAAAIGEITVDEAAGGAGDGIRERVKRTKFKLAEKSKNLELLMRYHKLLTDRVEIPGLENLYELIQQARRAEAANHSGSSQANPQS